MDTMLISLMRMDGGLVGVGALAAEVAFLHVLLGVVPGTAGVGHEYSQHEAGAEGAYEQTDSTGHSEEQTDEQGWPRSGHSQVWPDR